MLDNLMVNESRERVQNSDGKSLGYWAAHEQYSMHDLLRFVIEAEKFGFKTTMTSDHFHPWWHDHAYCNFVWVWIAAAAERTKNMQFITGVTAPIYRYHPAIIAQAFASLDILYPGRIGLGLGSGESMNEVPLGFDWPSQKHRLSRVIEAAQIINKLWYPEKENNTESINTEGFVRFSGEFFLIRDAKLYSPPTTHIPIFIAAAGPKSAKAAAKYSDGLITFLKAKEAKKIIDIFDKSIEKGSKERNINSKEKIVEYKVSYSDDYKKALESSKFWSATLLNNAFNTNISDPRKLEQQAKAHVSNKILKQSIEITTSIEDCLKSIEEYFNVGFTRVYVHSTSPDEMKFIREFGKNVLPFFQG